MNKKYFYHRTDGQRSDPIDLEDLVTLIQTNILPRNVLVWTEGMPNWAPYASLFPMKKPSGLQSLPAIPHAGPPPLLQQPPLLTPSVPPPFLGLPQAVLLPDLPILPQPPPLTPSGPPLLPELPQAARSPVTPQPPPLSPSYPPSLPALPQSDRPPSSPLPPPLTPSPLPPLPRVPQAVRPPTYSPPVPQASRTLSLETPGQSSTSAKPPKSLVPLVVAVIVVLCAGLGGGGWWIHRENIRKEVALKLAQDAARQEATLRQGEAQTRKEEDQKRMEAEQLARAESEARTKAEADAQTQTQAQAQDAQKALNEADMARQKLEIALARKQLELDQTKQQARAANQSVVQQSSSGNTPAKILKVADCGYPDYAVRSGADPTQEYIVRVKIFVDETGRATQFELVNGPPATYGFNAYAMNAARRSTYSPAIQFGRTYSSVLVQDFKFKSR